MLSQVLSIGSADTPPPPRSTPARSRIACQFGDRIEGCISARACVSRRRACEIELSDRHKDQRARHRAARDRRRARGAQGLRARECGFRQPTSKRSYLQKIQPGHTGPERNSTHAHEPKPNEIVGETRMLESSTRCSDAEPERAHFLKSAPSISRAPLGAYLQFKPILPTSTHRPAPGNGISGASSGQLERRIEATPCANAMAMWCTGPRRHRRDGGHLPRMQSSATLYEVGIQHFRRDAVGASPRYGFIQGHSSRHLRGAYRGRARGDWVHLFFNLAFFFFCFAGYYFYARK